MHKPEKLPSENAVATEEALRWMRGVGAEPALLAEVARTVRRRRYMLGMSLGAVGVVTIGLWFFFGINGLSRWHTPMTATVFEPLRETLPDGSVAELKPGTEWVTTFSSSERRVELKRGEAHFAVVKDVNRPFIVSASGVEVRAVGTAFSVGLGMSEVDVLVTSGRVAMAKVATEQPATLVDAGQHARLSPADVSVEVESVSPETIAERLAWRIPQIEFSRTPLAEAVALINARGGAGNPMRIVADPSDEGLRDLRLSGFLAADNTEGFLLLLENNFGIRAERIDERTMRLRAAR